jgi:predicted MFS family arabinose efflux permease
MRLQRPGVIGSFGLFGLFNVMSAVAPTLPVLLAARVLSALAASVYVPAAAASPPCQRATVAVRWV